MDQEARAKLLAHLKTDAYGDPEAHHSKAEDLLMDCLDPELREAWKEARGDWWYA